MAGKEETRRLMKEYIYIAFLQLLEAKDYADISVTDIVNRAGVSRMTYYRHFNSKEEIVTKHIEELYSHFHDDLLDCPDVSDAEFWTGFYSEFLKHPLIQTILNLDLDAMRMHVHKDFMLHMCEQHFRWDLSDEKNRMLAYTLLGGVEGMLLYIAENGDRSDIPFMTAMTLRVQAATEQLLERHAGIQGQKEVSG